MVQWSDHQVESGMAMKKSASRPARIGFLDSGVGGLTVLQEALKLMPDEDYLFYADTGHVPYGEKTKEEVRGYVLEAADYIAGQGVKALVVACNTATSIAVDELRRRYDFPVLGIEPAVKPAVLREEGSRRKVLVLATALTLREEKYHRLVETVDPGERVDSLALPGLVRLAENFEFGEERVTAYLREAFEGVNCEAYGTVVLGCTHFPYFQQVLQRWFGPGVALISGGPGTARNLRRILESAGRRHEGTGRIDFGASGRDAEGSRNFGDWLDRLNRIR